MPDRTRILWPGGKAFAFTIVDDTDQSRLPGIRAVYDVLIENGLQTTKTVWPLNPLGKPITGGDSLENPEYNEWVRTLRHAGFEIAVHGVSDESSTRERVVRGLDIMREFLDRVDPAIYVNHVGQREGIYWGSARFDSPVRQLYRAYSSVTGHDPGYYGHVEGTPYYWGDLCRSRVRFVRGLTWRDINTLKADPLMPYSDPRRPFVRHWFSASYGSSVKGFCELISEANQDRLAEEGGACIAYTHLGSTFYPLNLEFVRLIRRLGSLGGWYVPASTILQLVGDQRGWLSTANHRLTYRRMQWRWFLDQILHRL